MDAATASDVLLARCAHRLDDLSAIVSASLKRDSLGRLVVSPESEPELKRQISEILAEGAVGAKGQSLTRTLSDIQLLWSVTMALRADPATFLSRLAIVVGSRTTQAREILAGVSPAGHA